MVIQPILSLVQLCAQNGITQVFISPGSRNAPLSLAFARHGSFTITVLVDERSAAFVALGAAQQLKLPTILVCTSGTAALNYAPAVAEAFFSHIPLLILTADRPQEWIGQADGQAIYQQNIFGKHAHLSFQWPADWDNSDAVWFANRTANEAINHLFVTGKGPVHINIPFREPFYPIETDSFEYPTVRQIEVLKPEPKLSANQLHDSVQFFLNCAKVLVVVGQYEPDLELKNALYALNYYGETTIVADVTSNLHRLEKVIKLHDWFLMGKNQTVIDAIKPDLLITCGRSVLSKNLKNFLRTANPKQHWHIQEGGYTPDSFQTLTHIFNCEPSFFFKKLGEQVFFAKNVGAVTYANQWNSLESETQHIISDALLENSEAEISKVKQLLPKIPTNAILHIANSMPVRYVNLLQNILPADIQVFANRGTSGIDGSISTAVGAALTTSLPVYVLTGDLSFFYDKNALWNNHLPKNLKIIILNNGGGNIFRMIDGPSKQPELVQLFETEHHNTAEAIAQHFGLVYFSNSETEIATQMEALAQNSGAAIFEIFTDRAVNASSFTHLKSLFTKNGK
jgi:2-succinyl-5-enolpyruvyl-6-hydroxy-3-cyclohexene-1-carboxylate synthase